MSVVSALTTAMSAEHNALASELEKLLAKERKTLTAYEKARDERVAVQGKYDALGEALKREW